MSQKFQILTRISIRLMRIRNSIGFDLERIIAITVLFLEPQISRAKQVSRDEQRTPALVLSDMNVLMVSSNAQHSNILANDCVAKCHRQDAIAVNVPQQPGQHSTMKLQTSTSPLTLAATDQTQNSHQKPNQRIRKRPDVIQNTHWLNLC